MNTADDYFNASAFVTELALVRGTSQATRALLFSWDSALRYCGWLRMGSAVTPAWEDSLHWLRVWQERLEAAPAQPLRRYNVVLVVKVDP